MKNLSDVRRGENRCEAMLVEYGKRAATQRPRSWRCQLVIGHNGNHVPFSGHRNWSDPTAGRWINA